MEGVADGLEHGPRDDAEAREREDDADDPQGGGADGQHLLRRGEEAQQRGRDGLKEQAAHAHDGDGRRHRQAEGPLHPVHPSRAVVVADDGHHGVVQAEDRHEDEALQLEVGPEDGGGRLGEADEDLVHAEGHHRADGLHDDGGHADAVDLPGDGAVPAEEAPAEMEFRIVPEIEVEGQPRRDDLAQDRRDGGARHLQPGEAQKTEDQDGVHHDVDGRTHDLGEHGELGPPRGLQQPLQAELAEKADGGPQADADVVRPVVHDDGVLRLGQEEGPPQREADDGEEHEAAKAQEDANVRRVVGALLPLLPEGPGDEGVHAHPRAAGHGDHQGLQGEGQGHGVHGVLAQHGHEHAVHHVVEGLEQHGDHHGHRHPGQELPLRQHAHLVFLQWGLFHIHGSKVPFRPLSAASFSGDIQGDTEGGRRASPFGSVYFFNSPVACWVR